MPKKAVFSIIKKRNAYLPEAEKQRQGKKK